MKHFYDEVLPKLDRAIDEDNLLSKQVYSTTANGPVGHYKISRQKEVRAGTNRLVDAVKKEKFADDVAVFSGKGKVREMKEQPLQCCFNSVMNVRGIRGKAGMDAASIHRIWPFGEDEKFFLVRMGTKAHREEIIEEVIAAGTSNSHAMETLIEVGSEELRKQIQEDMRRTEGGLYEATIQVRANMMATIGGRNMTKGDVKGKGKGKGKDREGRK